jgi:hypothetical protein
MCWKLSGRDLLRMLLTKGAGVGDLGADIGDMVDGGVISQGVEDLAGMGKLLTSRHTRW